MSQRTKGTRCDLKNWKPSQVVTEFETTPSATHYNELLQDFTNHHIFCFTCKQQKSHWALWFSFTLYPFKQKLCALKQREVIIEKRVSSTKEKSLNAIRVKHRFWKGNLNEHLFSTGGYEMTLNWKSSRPRQVFWCCVIFMIEKLWQSTTGKLVENSI